MTRCRWCQRIEVGSLLGSARVSSEKLRRVKRVNVGRDGVRKAAIRGGHDSEVDWRIEDEEGIQRKAARNIFGFTTW